MVYAHTASLDGKWESLSEHLYEVARICAANCRFALLDEGEGYIAGLLHDLGKSGQLFQDVLVGKETKVDHESPGAYWAIKKMGAAAYDIALAVHAHHKGLLSDDSRTFANKILIEMQPQSGGRRFSCSFSDMENFCKDNNIKLPNSSTRKRNSDPFYAMLRVRLLLSALCDADYAATAAHFERTSELYRYKAAKKPEFETAFQLLTEYRYKLIQKSTSAQGVNCIRNDLYDCALKAAEQPCGSFSLSAPTGSGKTLATLAFALRHAVIHGKARIIYVLPYLTLIEQAASEIKKALATLVEGGSYLFEDHSNSTQQQSGFFVPDWSEPIIVTTTIKFFEGLFSNRPANLRHLHNVAGSVVVFDEAQSLPQGYANKTLKAMSVLCEQYGVSAVFSTATQPAFEVFAAQWKPKEIVPAELRLFERAKRVLVDWSNANSNEVTWSQIAAELLQYKQALAVVNTRKQAQKLTEAILATGNIDYIFHISTNMSVAHRQDVLVAVLLRLGGNLPCIVVSTQCIEAGVDISFPVVYRALAPLDSIIQAFGRCNRGGEQPFGTAKVFLPPLEDRHYPNETYELGAVRMLRTIKQQGGVDLNEPEQVHCEFVKYAKDIEGEQIKGKYKAFEEAIAAKDYQGIQQHYHWIDRRGINIIVPYEKTISLYNELVATKHKGTIKRSWLAKAQSIGVNITIKKDAVLLEYLMPILCYYDNQATETGWFYPIKNDVYSNIYGLLLEFKDKEEDFLL